MTESRKEPDPAPDGTPDRTTHSPAGAERPPHPGKGRQPGRAPPPPLPDHRAYRRDIWVLVLIMVFSLICLVSLVFF